MTSVLCRVSCRDTVGRVTWLHFRARGMASHGVAAPAAASHGHGVAHHDAHHDVYVPAYRHKIGKREIVGYGHSGEPGYADSIIWPYPACRFKEPSSVSASLLKKEEGDWKNLTVEDKKALYRYNYCETFVEMQAPSGQWKSITGMVLFWFSLAIWSFVGLKAIYPPLPETFSDEHRLAQLKRMIDLRVGAVDGLGSTWDYEKGRWKD